MPNNLQEKFEALTQREKIIVVFAILAGIWLAWDNFFYQSIQKKTTRASAEVNQP